MDIPDPATIQATLDELDALITEGDRIFRIAKECSFTDVVAGIAAEVRRTILPGCVLLLCAADGKHRKAIAQRYKRLQKMVS
jgi:hypothetical protein